jgi:hypothetical protein
MVKLYLHSPIRHHGVVFNQLSTGTTLPLLSYESSFERDAFTKQLIIVHLHSRGVR